MNFHTMVNKTYRYLAQKTTGKRVVFHHVPRCGGTSVSRSIRVKYILSQFSLNATASYQATTQFDREKNSKKDVFLNELYAHREWLLLYALNNYYYFIGGHIRFNMQAYNDFNHLYKFVTVLREPVSRFMSDYYKNYGKESYSGTKKPIKEYINTVEAKVQSTIYCNYFSGLPAGADFSSDIALAMAKENILKFDCVGFLSNMPIFADTISIMLGKRIHIGHENKSRQPKEETTHADSENRKAIEKMCAKDLDFYNYALRHFGKNT